jgi:hypothetical protein
MLTIKRSPHNRKTLTTQESATKTVMAKQVKPAQTEPEGVMAIKPNDLAR